MARTVTRRTQAPTPFPESHEPPTEAAEIDLGVEETGDVEVDLEAAPPAPAAPAPTPAPVEPEPADDNPLQRAVEAQRRAEELQRTAQRERDDAIRNAREREEALRGERDDAQYNSVLTAIATEQATLDKAEQDYAIYASAGDWASAAKAQRVIGTAGARLDRLEENKIAFEQGRTEPKPRPAAQPQQPAPQPLDFEQKIAALPDPAKDWLRKHPEFMNDNTMNSKITAAHTYLVQNKGLTAFTPAYFDALDGEFGFKAPPAAEPAPAPQPQRRSMPMTAPVSRDVPSASGVRTTPGKMHLTAEERQIAHLSIPDTPGLPPLSKADKELIYARNKKKYQAQKANGQYSEQHQ